MPSTQSIRHRIVPAAALAAALACSAASPASALPAGDPPDPAPYGPQRPYEADVAGPANVDTLAARVTRSGAGLQVTFDRRSAADDGGVPAAARRFVFLLDRSLELHLGRFPVCAESTLAAAGPDGCPPGSVVGHGAAVQHDGSESAVSAVNTRYPDGSRGVLVHIAASGVVLRQTQEPVTGRYRHDYRWALDEILPPTPVPPQDRAGTARFVLTFGATRTEDGRRVHLITRRGGAPTVKIGLWSEFVTGQVVLPEARARVRR